MGRYNNNTLKYMNTQKQKKKMKQNRNIYGHHLYRPALTDRCSQPHTHLFQQARDRDDLADTESREREGGIGTARHSTNSPKSLPRLVCPRTLAPEYRAHISDTASGQ